MAYRVELVDRLVTLSRSNKAATFFLNGPPGAGKSYILGQLAQLLPVKIVRSFVLGPYEVTRSEMAKIGPALLHDVYEAGFVDEYPLLSPGLDLAGVWQWLADNAHLPPGQSFVTLIDLVEPFHLNFEAYANLFSTIRYLEGTWSQTDVRILHLCAGHWDPPGLEHYFQRINTSFPYTVGHNYAVWNGISTEDMLSLVQRTRPGEASPLLGNMLFELTSGHPAAALDILNGIPAGGLSFAALLASAHKAARDGAAGQALLQSWCELPSDAKSLLRALILRRHLPAMIPPSLLERLMALGLVRMEQVSTGHYTSFASWYVELVVRLHAQELGVADEETSRIRVDELVPQVSSLNLEAYRVINDVENQVRNFVATHLCGQKAQDRPILQGRGTKYNTHTNVVEDAQKRAEDWQARSTERGLPTTLNPLMSYLSTRDLADLVAEVGAEIGSHSWQRIARALDDLAGVRDAVMHNQFIDELALQRLYDLQFEIYEALAKNR
jgi:hypothetical protein